MSKSMKINWVIRSAALLSLLTLSATANGFSTRTESWSEDALLHDGRIVKVNREVEYTFQLFYGDGGSPGMFGRWPDKFWFQFKHPDTQETVKWQGKQYFDPVLVDIVDGVPYLVVYGQPDKKTEKIYGCPDLPYIFFKYEKGGLGGKWTPIQVEQFPGILQDANLSPDFSYSTQASRHLSRDEVLGNIRKVEGSSGGNFQAKIPRGYDTWYSDYKNSRKNERKTNDCRPPRQPPAKVQLPAPQEVVLEILEIKDYTPDRLISPDEWARVAFDEKRSAYCGALFKSADPDDSWMGERFVKDSTGQKRTPYDNFDIRSGAKRLCDRDNIWFFAHLEEPNKMVLTKYTTAGDLLYRISFANPEDVKDFFGYIMPPTLKSENGYLYLEWWHFRDIEREWHVKRSLKVRLSEPKSSISTAIGQNATQISNANKAKATLTQPIPQPAVKSFRDCPSCPVMVAIPGKSYAIGKYEVTQAEWKALMGENVQDDRSGPTVGVDKPVLNKDWYGAQKYIAQLNKMTGKNYRLPTEAEWEYACYGGSQTEYCGGNDIDTVAWYKKNSERIPHPVGQKQPNVYGLYDMSGNVWEWTDDCWKGNCALRILRGSSFLYHPLSARAAYIYGKTMGEVDIGFRVAGTLNDNRDGLLLMVNPPAKSEQLPRSGAGTSMACGCPVETPFGKCKCSVSVRGTCLCAVEK